MKETEQHRLNMLTRLERVYGKEKPPEIVEAERIITEYSQSKHNADLQIARAKQPLPTPLACPECLVKTGIDRQMIAVTADDPNRFDRFKCRTCGYSVDVNA